MADLFELDGEQQCSNSQFRHAACVIPGFVGMPVMSPNWVWSSRFFAHTSCVS